MPLYTEDTTTRSFLPLSEIPSSFADVMEAQFASTVTELPSVAAQRIAELQRARGRGARLTLDDAAARIETAGLTGELTPEDGITDAALDILIERKQDELRRASTLARAQGGFGEGAARLGVALATSLADPVNVGMAFIPVVGQARYAKLLAGAGSALGRAGVRVGIGAIEGAAGAAIVEPLIYTAKQQEQADYDMADALMNVAFGTIFGGGLHVVGGAGADLVRFARGESKWADDIVLPRDQLKAFYEERVRGTPKGEPVTNPKFEIGSLSPDAVTQVRSILPDLPEGVDSVRMSGRAVKHLEDRRPDKVDGLLDRIGDIALAPDEVLPNPQNPSRALLVKHDQERNVVVALEVARKQDALEIVSIFEANDRYLRKARAEKAATETAGRVSGSEGPQPPHRRLAPEAPHAGADFLRVDPDPAGEGSIPPSSGDLPARDITADATPEVREAALRTAVGQMADGRPVDVEPLFAGSQAEIAEAATRRAGVPDPEAARQAEVARQVDEEIAASNEALEAAEEEAALAEQLAEAQAKKYGVEATDSATEAAAALTKNAERWSQIAEAASSCLLRGS